jgi:hypothetical protein
MTRKWKIVHSMDDIVAAAYASEAIILQVFKRFMLMSTAFAYSSCTQKIGGLTSQSLWQPVPMSLTSFSASTEYLQLIEL